MAVRAVFFDVGETLVDETRHWRAWAEYLDVPEFTFFAVLGGVVGRGEHHRRVFEIIRPDLDVEAATRELESSGALILEPSDLYPDAIPCLRTLRERGYHLGIAGNQSAAMEAALAGMGLPVDTIASSGAWGVEKPSPDFFERIIEACGVPAENIAYVGDRLDNDIVPAARAGMKAVFIRRGPWGYLHASSPQVACAAARIHNLDQLPLRLAELRVNRHRRAFTSRHGETSIRSYPWSPRTENDPHTNNCPYTGRHRP